MEKMNRFYLNIALETAFLLQLSTTKSSDN